MEIIIIVIQLFANIILYLLIKGYLSSYLSEKGKNLAKKEDIKDITYKIEDVKSIFEKDKIKFHSYHNKKIEILSTLYSLMIEARDSMYDYSAYIKIGELKPEEERKSLANKSLNSFLQYYKRNKIYIDENTQAKIENFFEVLLKSSIDYQLGCESKIDINEAEKYFKSADNKILKEAEEILKDFEKEFKKTII